MTSKQLAGSTWPKGGDARSHAGDAILQILEPLAGFAIDSGLSVSDLQALFRQAAVKHVALRQLNTCDRVNISGIAATTGIPRGEISRILKANGSQKDAPRKKPHQKSTNRILTAWYEQPRFTNRNGQPADLKIFGPGATFETLVKAYGRGIPPRAVLDELVRSKAVEVLPRQRIRAKSPVAVDRGISPRAIREFGDRAHELLSTMLVNMSSPETPLFLANIIGAISSTDALPLFRKELSGKGAEFLTELQESLAQEAGARSKSNSTAVSVTVFCHESCREKPGKRPPRVRRKNFRRET